MPNPPAERQPLQYLLHRMTDQSGVPVLRVQAAFLDTQLSEFEACRKTIMDAIRLAGPELCEEPFLAAVNRGSLLPLVSLNLSYRPIISSQGIDYRLAQLRLSLQPKYAGLATMTPTVEFGRQQLTCHATVKLLSGNFQPDPNFRFDNPFVSGLVLTPQSDTTCQLEFKLERAAVIGLEVLDAEYERAIAALGVCLGSLDFDNPTRARLLKLARGY